MTQPIHHSLLARFREGLSRLWGDGALDAKGGDLLILSPDLSDADLARLESQMRHCLEVKGGDVSARARAVALGREYLSLSAVGRKRFLMLLAGRFATDPDKVAHAIAAWQQAAPDQRVRAERDLRKILDAPRRKLLTQFNALPEGVKFLVDMRAELLDLSRDEPLLADLAADLKHLLISWFDVGFLELKRITWRSAANILEKIMAYEAVHAIQGWDDLKNRLDSDRRLYAFFHPRMPDEPLIFVEVALVNGISDNIHDLLDQAAPLGNPDHADTAIFYSINAAQKGLSGISFGNFLIKRVVAELSAEFKSLRTFATLSPIPGFRRWLTMKLDQGEAGLLSETERNLLRSHFGLSAKGALKTALEEGQWIADPVKGEALRIPLTRLAARYLALEKKGSHARALDDVANFHLSNGARIQKINWLANGSDKGLRESFGLMVNYLYRPDEIEANHEAYATTGKAPISSEVRGLLNG